MAERQERFDLVVVGGGSAGVAAALAAARLGARTALIERYGFLGGAATNALVLTYDGFFYRRPAAEWSVGGIAREVIDRLGDYGPPVRPRLSSNGNWVLLFNPEAAKATLDDLVISAGVSTRLHALVIDASRNNERLTSVVIADHGGRTRITADAFIDASGEGDLSALAGAAMAFADQPPQAASLCLRIGGLAGDLDRAMLGEAAARATPALGTASLRATGGFTMRLAENGDFWWMGIDVRTDGLTSQSLTQAEQDCRAAAWAFIRALRALPGCAGASLVGAGVQLGIRETRHPRARVMIDTANALAGCRCETTIGRSAWQLERHDTPGQPFMAQIGGEGFFDIPADALRAEGMDNLWLAGRLAGADRGACSSLRVMGPAFVTGQAAGTAAALSLAGQPGYAPLRRALLAAGAVL